MAVSTTSRFGFKQYSAGTDPYPTRVEFNALMDLHENNAAMFAQGATTARPPGGKIGRFYWDTDVARLYYDNGASWQEVTTNGGGGIGKPITPNTAGTEGVSARSARADHTHNLPLATASADGAMSATDKALLNTASATATAGSLVKLDGSGRSQVAAPAAAADVANKSYVDTETAKRALAAHSHAAGDITSGVLAAARLPAVTTAAQGAMLAADKVKLDGAVSAATAGALVLRDAAGRAAFADPSALSDAATKGYVDAGLGGKSDTTHAHAFTDITGRPATYPAAWDGVSGKPAIFPSDWANVAGKPAIFPSDWANVAGKPATMPSTWATVSGKPTTFAPSAHTHLWADLTDKPTTFAPAAHAHDWASITGKPATFPATAHTHTSAGITMSSARTLQQDYDTHGAYIEDLAGRIDKRLTVASFLDRIDTGSASMTGMHAPDRSAGIYVGGSRVYSTFIYNYNVAYGSYRACWVNSDGSLGYNLSSRKYKTDERDYVVPLETLKRVTPQWFKYKHDVAELGFDAAPDRVNFIAEDLHDVGLEEYVSYNGEPGANKREDAETVNEQLIVNALWSFAQQHQTLIEGMRKELDELKAGR